MIVKSYYKDPDFNPEVVAPYVGQRLTYTGHAVSESLWDERGKIPLPVRLPDGMVVEIDLVNGQVKKFVTRAKCDEKRDVILAVKVEDNRLTVKTVWSLYHGEAPTRKNSRQ